MALERPPLESYISNSSPIRPSARKPLESYVSEPKQEASIYSTGGAYDQFGPKVRAFNPVSKFGQIAGPLGAAAEQPGSALPFVGQVAGGMSPLGPIGGVAGAVAGEGARQLIGRGFGVQKGADAGKQLMQAGKSAAIAELTGVGLNSASVLLKPFAKKSAITMAQKVLKPTGRYRDKAAQIAETALKEGVLSGNIGKTVERTQAKIDAVDDQLDAILTKYKDRTGTAEDVIDEMKALKNQYLNEYADEIGAAKVDDVIGQIQRQHGIKEDVFGRVETPNSQPENGFIIKKGSPSVQKTPTVKKVPTYGKKSNDVRNFLKDENQIFGKTSLENPEEVLISPRQNKKGYSKEAIIISPEVKTSTIQEDISSPKVFGPDKSEAVKVGEKYRDLKIGEMQKNKRGLYRGLESKRVGGAYGAETAGADITSRQTAARGYRKAIEKAVPEEDIKGINRRFADLLELGGAANNRLPVAERSNYFDLGDLVLGGAAIGNPKALSIAALRKIVGSGRAPIARSMYKFGSNNPGRFGKSFGRNELSPVRRALLAQALTAGSEQE